MVMLDFVYCWVLLSFRAPPASLQLKVSVRGFFELNMNETPERLHLLPPVPLGFPEELRGSLSGRPVIRTVTADRGCCEEGLPDAAG